MTDFSHFNESLDRAKNAITDLELQRSALEAQLQHANALDPTIMLLTVFILACFVGYYVVWRVTPALHTPLMSVTNAISGIIIVGAMIALGPVGGGITNVAGFVAVVIASINIFGGFFVTQRMLQMYRKKDDTK